MNIYSFGFREGNRALKAEFSLVKNRQNILIYKYLDSFLNLISLAGAPGTVFASNHKHTGRASRGSSTLDVSCSRPTRPIADSFRDGHRLTQARRT